MPILRSHRESLLVVNVDGDFTSAEADRNVREGLADPETARPARVMLDLSGAAGVSARGWDTMLDPFVEAEEAVYRIAVLGYGLSEPEVPEGAKFELRLFEHRAAAFHWLVE